MDRDDPDHPMFGRNMFLDQLESENRIKRIYPMYVINPADPDDWTRQPMENTMEKHMNFGMALDALKRGSMVQREGWNGKGMWLNLQRPDENSKMTEPYIYMKTAQDGQIPWMASQADMLAEDWQIVN